MFCYNKKMTLKRKIFIGIGVVVLVAAAAVIYGLNRQKSY